MNNKCEDCSILMEEIDRLTSELEHRDEPKSNALEHVGLIKRFFTRFFGPLIYDGEKTCGHCKYWTDPRHPRGLEWKDTKGRARYALGDCKLLVGPYDTTYKQSCHRFTPRRRYMRRVKTWLKKA